eukprot:352421-Chlamydomonas_euryale.AAC.27
MVDLEAVRLPLATITNHSGAAMCMHVSICSNVLISMDAHQRDRATQVTRSWFQPWYTCTCHPCSNWTHPRLNACAAGAGIKRVALLTFGQHAMEVITSEVALPCCMPMLSGQAHLAALGIDVLMPRVTLPQALLGDMDELLGWEQTRAALQDAGIRTAAPGATLHSWRDNILQKLELKLIPIENLDGRELFEAGEVCRRRTGSGVDLNRNWGHAWAPASKHSESYGGAKPFSEPQSQYIRERAEEWNPAAFINTHSGEWAVYIPWDSRQSVGSGLPMMPAWPLMHLHQVVLSVCLSMFPQTQLQSLMDSVGAVCHCITGPAGAVSGYLAYGTTMDYMYVELGVPYALTIEVYGAGNEGKLKAGALQDVAPAALSPANHICSDWVRQANVLIVWVGQAIVLMV